MDSKEFKRDGEGCLNLQNRVTDVDHTENLEFNNDSKDVEKLKDILNDSEYTDDCPGYILALPFKNSQDSSDELDSCDEDDDDEIVEDADDKAVDKEVEDFLSFQFNEFYNYQHTVKSLLYSLKQREINKKRKEKLKDIAHTLDSIATGSFRERKETVDIMIETFKQIVYFQRSYKFYLDELKNLKEILNDQSLSKDLSKSDMLEIKKRKKEIKRTLKTFLNDMEDTSSALIFDEEQYRLEDLRTFDTGKGFNHP